MFDRVGEAVTKRRMRKQKAMDYLRVSDFSSLFSALQILFHHNQFAIHLKPPKTTNVQSNKPHATTNTVLKIK